MRNMMMGMEGKGWEVNAAFVMRISTVKGKRKRRRQRESPAGTSITSPVFSNGSTSTIHVLCAEVNFVEILTKGYLTLSRNRRFKF